MSSAVEAKSCSICMYSKVVEDKLICCAHNRNVETLPEHWCRTWKSEESE